MSSESVSLNVFESFAPKFFEKGLPVIPIKPGEKRPTLSGWSKYCENIADDEEFDKMLVDFKDYGIGLCLGPASGMVGIDFDYDGPHAQKLETLFRKALLYNSPVEKRGRKNKFTLFYKYHPDIKSEAIDSVIKSAEGKSIRFVDVLSVGKQTVIPPTIHPDTKEPYFYTYGNLQNIEVDELPPITADEINAIKLIASMSEKDLVEMSVGLKGNRHDTIVAYAFKIIDYCKNIEQFNEKLFSFDVEKHGDKSYFKDKKYRKNMAPEVHCAGLAKRLYLWVQRKRKEGGVDWEFGKKKAVSDKLKCDYDSFEIFFKETVKLEKDLLTNKTFHKVDGEYRSILNFLGDLRSFAGEHGLHRDYVSDHLSRYMNTLKPELLLNIPKWDGVDRISQLTNFINIKNVSKEVFVDLFKEWCANIFKRIENPVHQNKLIIFKGTQGKGKDYFIMQLLKGFDHYYANISINIKESENYMIMNKKIVLNISEFDQVHRLHSGVLKDLITKDSAELRLPYARDSEDMKFRCSFIASCNPDEILTDPTGNRRFMIFEVDDIDWEYPKGQERQLLAQYHQLYKDGYKAKIESVKAMDKYIVQHTPDPIDDVILDMYADRFENLLRVSNTNGRKIKLVEFMPAINEICKNTGMRPSKVLHLLKRRGLKRRMRDGNWCYGLEMMHVVITQDVEELH